MSTLEVRNFSAGFKSSVLFEDVSFTLSENSFTALCGANGAGKSTLLSLLDGIIPDGISISGDILLDGKSVFSFKRNEIAKNISYLVQNETVVWNYTVDQFISSGLYAYEKMTSFEIKEAVDKVLKQVGIQKFSSKCIKNLSGGEFQKCRLARSFVQNADVLLFDEPGASLDAVFQNTFLRFLKTLHKTVLFSIHDINTASLFADDYLLIADKKVISGKRKDIFDEKVLEKAFGSSVKVFRHPIAECEQVLFL